MKRLSIVIFCLIAGCTTPAGLPRDLADSAKTINQAADSWNQKTKPVGKVEYDTIKAETQTLANVGDKVRRLQADLKEIQQKYDTLESKWYVVWGRRIQWLIVGWVVTGVIAGLFRLNFILDLLPLSPLFRLLGRFRG